MIVYLALGTVGFILLVSSWLIGDLIDAAVPDVDFLSGPVVGGALAGFGLCGWAALSAFELSVGWSIVVSGAGFVVVAYFTRRAMALLVDQPTDATPTTAGLIGTSGRVVTPVGAGSLGEVVVSLGGAPTKFTARGVDDAPIGSRVEVVGIESNTCLVVRRQPSPTGTPHLPDPSPPEVLP